MGKVRQHRPGPRRLQCQCIFVPLHAVSLHQFTNNIPILIVSHSLLGERKYSHAIPPVSMVLVEVCWTGVMTVLTFVSSVLSTRHGPAKMCSSTPGKRSAADIVRRLTDKEIHSESGHVFFLNPDSPSFVDDFFYSYASSLNSAHRLLIFFSTVFVYSLMLLIVTVLHAPLVPNIWCSNISGIPWFDFSAPPVSRITHDSFPPDKSDLEGQTVYGDAFRSVGDDERETLKAPPRPPWSTLPRGSLAISVTSFTPTWAKQHNAGLTRGLHNPFSRSLDDDSIDHQSLDVPSDPIQLPARVITRPTYEHRLHERDDDPFAAPSKHDTITTKVPDDSSDRTQSLQPLAGFSNLPRWSADTASGEDQGTGKRGIGMLMLHNPSDRASNTTATTATAVPFSPLGRKSVSSMFPHDVREEDWSFPLTKPPFSSGRSEGWTTAGAIQDAAPAGSGRGRR